MMGHVPIEVSAPLRDCLTFCEVECVIACCGIDAISTDPAHVAQWRARVRPEAAAEARRQAAELIAIVEDRSHDVESAFLNHRTLGEAGRRELLDVLTAFREHLAARSIP